MNICLTPQQQQQELDSQGGNTPRVIDPRTNAAYVLIPEVDYETVRELLDEERRQQAIHAVGLQNAAGPHRRSAMIQPGEIYTVKYYNSDKALFRRLNL